MVSWMQSVGDHPAQLRELHELGAARIDARFDQVRGQIDLVNARIAIVANELKSKIDQRFADLIKWSFVFWCGAVAAAVIWRG